MGSPNLIERRAFTLDELRVERRDADSPPRIIGHAAVFNQWSLPIGYGFRERIRPGAFKKTLREADVRALFNHNQDYVLGRTKSGTLSLREDDTGLAFDVMPPDTTYARDLLVSIERGDIDESSFGFNAVKESWGSAMIDGEAVSTREVIEARLFDVSPVTFPAYPQTDVQVRSLLEGAGINWQALGGAIARSKQGVPATSDREIIEAAREVLRGFLPPEPAQGDHSERGDGGEPDQGVPLAILRRRLEIEAAVT